MTSVEEVSSDGGAQLYHRSHLRGPAGRIDLRPLVWKLANLSIFGRPPLAACDLRVNEPLALNRARKEEALSSEGVYVCRVCLLKTRRAAGAMHDWERSEGRTRDAIGLLNTGDFPESTKEQVDGPG